MDVRYTVLISFLIIAQCSEGTHYFHRVVGLVVNIHQWSTLLNGNFQISMNDLSGLTVH